MRDIDWELEEAREAQRHYQAYQQEDYIPCDICKTGQACAGTNGYCVCSEHCSFEAEQLPPKDQTGGNLIPGD